MTEVARYLVERMQRHWRTKLWLGAMLTAIFCTGYFGIQRLPLRQPVSISPFFMDGWIGFSPGWAWAYQSIYLLLPLAWLATTRADLWRYARGFGLMMLVGFACFVVLPVAGPRPAEVPTGGMYGFIASYDSPLNSFPSLHMALATYSAAAGVSFVDGNLRRTLSMVLPAWIVLIAFSTLATKQHYFVDLPPGVFLGWIAHRIAWRGALHGAKVLALVPPERGTA